MCRLLLKTPRRHSSIRVKRGGWVSSQPLSPHNLCFSLFIFCCSLHLCFSLQKLIFVLFLLIPFISPSSLFLTLTNTNNWMVCCLLTWVCVSGCCLYSLFGVPHPLRSLGRARRQDRIQRYQHSGPNNCCQRRADDGRRVRNKSSKGNSSSTIASY